jgi:hypothetical protein
MGTGLSVMLKVAALESEDPTGEKHERLGIRRKVSLQSRGVEDF